MDFHLERSLRLHTEPEHKNLYSWAINELDAQGKQIGLDQIPWIWTLYFTAASCVLADRVDVKAQNKTKEPASAKSEITQSQVIQLQLRPGHTRDEGNFFRETTFSMFGTDREIKNFQMSIYPINDATQLPNCTVWGTVSYTAEVDFREVLVEDCIEFSLFVATETFARYAAKISDGLIDEIILSVGSVAGFYSEWSPSISTRDVKVLTNGDEHKITLPSGLKFELPRLGDVGAAGLHINRRLEFDKRTPVTGGTKDVPDVRIARLGSQIQSLPAVELPTSMMLISIRRAAWFVVVFLALIFVTTLLKQ